MRTRFIHILYPAFLLLLGCEMQKGPELHTEEVALIRSFESHVRFVFVAPDRNIPEHFWAYRLGLIFPKETHREIEGKVLVFSSDGKIVQSIDFSKTVRSNWIKREASRSYIVPDDLNLIDGNKYDIFVVLNKRRNIEIPIVMHYLKSSE